MTLKRYQVIRLIIVIVIAIIFSQSIILKNFFVPVITLIISSLVLFYLRKKVSGVIADERDWQSGGKAAMLAMQIYAWLAVIIMFLMYALQDANPYYGTAAMTLAFSTCVLMLLYSFIFRYYNKVKLCSRKNIYIIVVSLIFVMTLILALRIFSGEDTWICEDGQWTKHGQPFLPAPQTECK